MILASRHQGETTARQKLTQCAHGVQVAAAAHPLRPLLLCIPPPPGLQAGDRVPRALWAGLLGRILASRGRADWVHATLWAGLLGRAVDSGGHADWIWECPWAGLLGCMMASGGHVEPGKSSSASQTPAAFEVQVPKPEGSTPMSSNTASDPCQVSNACLSGSA